MNYYSGFKKQGEFERASRKNNEHPSDNVCIFPGDHGAEAPGVQHR